jgi:hypothetical protein
VRKAPNARAQAGRVWSLENAFRERSAILAPLSLPAKFGFPETETLRFTGQKAKPVGTTPGEETSVQRSARQCGNAEPQIPAGRSPSHWQRVAEFDDIAQFKLGWALRQHTAEIVPSGIDSASGKK